MKFEELQDLYKYNFSLGYISGVGDYSPIEARFILISLICHITYKTKLKKPDVTYYQIIMKLSDGLGLPDDFIKGLSIICEDFAYSCTKFPTFGLDKDKILNTVRNILKSYLPF